MSDNNNKTYEIAFVGVDEESGDEITNIITKHGGEITNRLSSPKKIILAYEIKKRREGFFGVFHFKVGAESLSEINTAINLNPSILRCLIVSVSEKTPKPTTKEDTSKVESDSSNKEDDKKNGDQSLSNEALEKKLEEILG